MIFFDTIYRIFSVYPLPEALLVARNYLRIIVRNRWPFVSPYRERVLFYTVEFPYRPHFFGMVSEIFFRRLYRLPDKKIKTIIDGGANIGLATLYFKWRHPEARVLCFEPNPEACAFLEKNISGNHLSGVKIFPYALGKTNGQAQLFTSSRIKGSSSASTIPPRDMERDFTVPMRRLSEFVDSTVDLLKLDVEGAEGDILADLEASGKLPFVRNIILEYHQYEPAQGILMGNLFSLLDRNGFQYLCFPLFAHVNFETPRGLRQYMIYAHKPT